MREHRRRADYRIPEQPLLKLTRIWSPQATGLTASGRV